MPNYTITVSLKGYQALSNTVVAASLESAQTFEAQAVQDWLAINVIPHERLGSQGFSGDNSDITNIRDEIMVKTVLQ